MEIFFLEESCFILGRLEGGGKEVCVRTPANPSCFSHVSQDYSSLTSCDAEMLDELAAHYSEYCVGMSTQSQSYSLAWVIFDKRLDNQSCPAFWMYKAEDTSYRVLPQPYEVTYQRLRQTHLFAYTYMSLQVLNICMHMHADMSVYDYSHLVNPFFLQVTEDNCIDLHSLSFSTAHVSFKSQCFAQPHIATMSLKEAFFLPSSFPLYLLSFNTYKINQYIAHKDPHLQQYCSAQQRSTFAGGEVPHYLKFITPMKSDPEHQKGIDNQQFSNCVNQEYYMIHRLYSFLLLLLSSLFANLQNYE